MMKSYEERMKEMSFEEYEVFFDEMFEAFHSDSVEEIDGDGKSRKVADKYRIKFDTINWYDFYGMDE